MTPERIRELGRLPFLRHVEPLKRERRSVATVYGLDTEYTRSGELVCWTVSGPGGDELFTRPLTIDALESHVQRTEPEAREAVFVAFFSLAELQWFDVVDQARELRVYGRGSTDVKFRCRRVQVSIVDVARFFDGQSLKAAAASFGLQKLDYNVTDVHHEDLRDSKFRDYAIRDARIVRIIFERLREEWLALGIDLLCYPTAAAAAAALWRRSYVEETIARPEHRHQRLALACAWGGRAEAFARGAWDGATELDLKSAYPRAVVSFGSFPRGEEWRDENRLDVLLAAPFALAEVDFQFPESTWAPTLPVMRDGRMLFPLRGRSCCGGDELRLAYSLGARLVVVRGMAADRGSDDSAQRFMEWAMETRAKVKGTARAYVAKLAANSLTGKWIQNRDGLDFDQVLAVASRENVRPAALFRLGPLEREELGIVARPMLGGAFMPTFYALTTSRVRARLGEALQKVPGAVYCATDSVWSREGAEAPSDEWDVKMRGEAVVARTRLGRIRDDKGEHLAFHAVSSKEAAGRLLDRFAKAPERDAEVHYVAKRPLGIKEGLRRDAIVGRWVLESGRKATTEWDGKRRLLPNNETAPWKYAHEREHER